MIQARLLGEHDLLRNAERFAREVGTPALYMSVYMARFSEGLGIDFADMGF